MARAEASGPFCFCHALVNKCGQGVVMPLLPGQVSSDDFGLWSGATSPSSPNTRQRDVDKHTAHAFDITLKQGPSMRDWTRPSMTKLTTSRTNWRAAPRSRSSLWVTRLRRTSDEASFGSRESRSCESGASLREALAEKLATQVLQTHKGEAESLMIYCSIHDLLR